MGQVYKGTMKPADRHKIVKKRTTLSASVVRVWRHSPARWDDEFEDLWSSVTI